MKGHPVDEDPQTQEGGRGLSLSEQRELTIARNREKLASLGLSGRGLLPAEDLARQRARPALSAAERKRKREGARAVALPERVTRSRASATAGSSAPGGAEAGASAGRPAELAPPPPPRPKQVRGEVAVFGGDEPSGAFVLPSSSSSTLPAARAGIKAGAVGLLKVVLQAKVTPERVLTTSVSPSGLVACGDKRGSVGLWNPHAGSPDGEVVNGKVSHGVTFELEPIHMGPISCLTFGGATDLFTASFDGMVRRVDLVSGRSTELIRDEDVAFLALASGNDGEGFVWVAGDSEGGVRRVDVRSPGQPAVMDVMDKVRSVAVSKDGYHLAVSAGTEARVYDLRASPFSKKPVPILVHPHSYAAQSVCFTSQGQLASSSYDDTVVLWQSDFARNSGKKTVVPHNNKTGRYTSPFKLAPSPDGDWIAIGGMNRSIDLIETRSGAVFQATMGLTAIPAALCWHPNGTSIAGASSSGWCVLMK